MKFKKVKIQAFRAYNKVDDGTFDFSLSDQRYADFVSLYAPNGFGKTSFYDAVEYAFTNNISRFIKKQKFNEETAKSQKNASSTEKQFILRNTFASIDLEAFIEINTTLDKLPSIKRPIALPYKGGRDFKFTEKDTERKYFREVVLSQEWIDAFLMVDDAAERYKTFIEYFGDKKLDEYYRKLIELISQNDKRIDGLKKQLHGIQKELNFKGDNNILKKVNDKIRMLNAFGESLNSIEESYTESGSLEFTNRISERLSDVVFEKRRHEELIKFVDVVFSGNEDIKGLEVYFESKVKQTELINKKTELSTLLGKFEERQRFVNERNKISEAQQHILKEKEKFEEIQKSFPIYLKSNEEIQKIENLIEKERRTKSSIDKVISDIRILESEQNTKLIQLQEQITATEAHLKELPLLLEKANSDKIKLNELQNKINDVDFIIKPIDQSKADLELQIFNLNTALKEIKKREYPSIFEKEFLSFKEIINKIEKNENELKEKRGSLNRLNIQIKEQETLNKDIEQFISKGAELIDKSQSSACPLCNYEHGSFKELSEKVSNNKLLSILLSSILKERSAIENKINEINERLDKDKKSLIDSLNKNLSEKQEKLTNISLSLSSAKENKQQLQIEHKTVLTSLQKYNALLKDLSYEEYEKDSKFSLEKLKGELALVVKELEKQQAELKQQISELNIIENKIKTLEEAIQNLRKEKSFTKLSEVFNLSFPSQQIELKIINQRIIEINKTIEDNILKVEALQNSIESLDEFIKGSTQELTEKQLELTVKSKELLQQIIISFEQEVTSKLNITIENFDKDSLIGQLEQIRNEARLTIEKQEQKIKEYNLLTELKKNVEPYLKYEKAKKAEAELKERKNFLENKVKKVLEEEKKKVSTYLDGQIGSFFYEDLINDLYRRIDPHPDYKKIKFICDFKDDKPKLNVCLYKDENFDDPIIPNLYFSTAQLNILSLSIFLAKALNAKDDEGNSIDCIFIDDPIQSLDSINILSTIDLLRSIVINQGKQIILSTHDENFHNLLKKKMPPNLFKSKFMELETFGKVKQEVANG